MTRERRFSESQIVRSVATLAGQRLAKRAISRLQQMHQTMSGDDSELVNIWDEICVQVQDERSFFWDAYEIAMRDALALDVEQLAIHEREAIWLQTDEGERWDFDETDPANVYPVLDDDICKYLIDEHLTREAERWSNARIRAFLDRAARSD